MLCLSRKLNEAIVIEGDIVIKICEIVGSRVILGIEAPRHKRVMREEVALAMAGNLAASDGMGP